MSIYFYLLVYIFINMYWNSFTLFCFYLSRNPQHFLYYLSYYIFLFYIFCIFAFIYSCRCTLFLLPVFTYLPERCLSYVPFNLHVTLLTYNLYLFTYPFILDYFHPLLYLIHHDLFVCSYVFPISTHLNDCFLSYMHYNRYRSLFYLCFDTPAWPHRRHCVTCVYMFNWVLPIMCTSWTLPFSASHLVDITFFCSPFLELYLFLLIYFLFTSLELTCFCLIPLDLFFSFIHDSLHIHFSTVYRMRLITLTLCCHLLKPSHHDTFQYFDDAF